MQSLVLTWNNYIYLLHCQVDKKALCVFTLLADLFAVLTRSNVFVKQILCLHSVVSHPGIVATCTGV